MNFVRLAQVILLSASIFLAMADLLLYLRRLVQCFSLWDLAAVLTQGAVLGIAAYELDRLQATLQGWEFHSPDWWGLLLAAALLVALIVQAWLYFEEDEG